MAQGNQKLVEVLKKYPQWTGGDGLFGDRNSDHFGAAAFAAYLKEAGRNDLNPDEFLNFLISNREKNPEKYGQLIGKVQGMIDTGTMSTDSMQLFANIFETEEILKEGNDPALKYAQVIQQPDTTSQSVAQPQGQSIAVAPIIAGAPIVAAGSVPIPDEGGAQVDQDQGGLMISGDDGNKIREAGIYKPKKTSLRGDNSQKRFILPKDIKLRGEILAGNQNNLRIKASQGPRRIQEGEADVGAGQDTFSGRPWFGEPDRDAVETPVPRPRKKRSPGAKIARRAIGIGSGSIIATFLGSGGQAAQALASHHSIIELIFSLLT